MRNQPSLGEAVKARRKQLGLSQDKISALADVNPVTWRRVENEEPVRQQPKVIARIEDALGWAPGTIARLEAGEPVNLDTGRSDDTSRLDALEAEIGELKAMLKEALTHLAPAPAKRRVGRR